MDGGSNFRLTLVPPKRCPEIQIPKRMNKCGVLIAIIPSDAGEGFSQVEAVTSSTASPKWKRGGAVGRAA